jgi:GNAT superfamily N-acetyltransferase
MNIRQAKPEDEPSLREMYLAFLTEVQPFGHDIPPSSESVDKTWSRYLKPAIELVEPVLIADHAGTAQGFVAYVRISPVSAINHAVYVRPGWRRQGIATDLINGAKARCRQIGVEKIFDMVSLTNEAALKMMARMGEEPIAYAYSLTP